MSGGARKSTEKPGKQRETRFANVSNRVLDHRSCIHPPFDSSHRIASTQPFSHTTVASTLSSLVLVLLLTMPLRPLRSHRPSPRISPKHFSQSPTEEVKKQALQKRFIQQEVERPIPRMDDADDDNDKQQRSCQTPPSRKGSVSSFTSLSSLSPSSSSSSSTPSPSPTRRRNGKHNHKQHSLWQLLSQTAITVGLVIVLGLELFLSQSVTPSLHPLEGTNTNLSLSTWTASYQTAGTNNLRKSRGNPQGTTVSSSSSSSSPQYRNKHATNDAHPSPESDSTWLMPSDQHAIFLHANQTTNAQYNVVQAQLQQILSSPARNSTVYYNLVSTTTTLLDEEGPSKKKQARPQQGQHDMMSTMVCPDTLHCEKLPVSKTDNEHNNNDNNNGDDASIGEDDPLHTLTAVYDYCRAHPDHTVSFLGDPTTTTTQDQDSSSILSILQASAVTKTVLSRPCLDYSKTDTTTTTTVHNNNDDDDGDDGDCNTCGLHFAVSPYFHYSANGWSATCRYIGQQLMAPAQLHQRLSATTNTDGQEQEVSSSTTTHTTQRWITSHPSLHVCKAFPLPLTSLLTTTTSVLDFTPQRVVLQKATNNHTTEDQYTLLQQQLSEQLSLYNKDSGVLLEQDTKNGICQQLFADLQPSLCNSHSTLLPDDSSSLRGGKPKSVAWNNDPLALYIRATFPLGSDSHNSSTTAVAVPGDLLTKEGQQQQQEPPNNNNNNNNNNNEKRARTN